MWHRERSVRIALGALSCTFCVGVIVSLLVDSPVVEKAARVESAVAQVEPRVADSTGDETAGVLGSLDPQTLQGLPVGFVENRGQWQQYAGDFIAIRDGIRLSLHPGGLGLCILEVRDGGLAGVGLRMDFENSSPEAHVRGKDQLPGIYNYLKGGDARF